MRFYQIILIWQIFTKLLKDFGSNHPSITLRHARTGDFREYSTDFWFNFLRTKLRETTVHRLIVSARILSCFFYPTDAEPERRLMKKMGDLLIIERGMGASWMISFLKDRHSTKSYLPPLTRKLPRLLRILSHLMREEYNGH